MKKLLVIIIVLAVIVGGTLIFYSYVAGPIDKNNTTSTFVTIDNGSSTGEIGNQLKEKGLIRNESIFKLKSRIGNYDGNYIAGTYKFNKAMSMKEMMDFIKEGKTAGKVFQVIEGKTIDKVAEQLEKEGIINKKEFYYEVEHGDFDYKFMKYLPKGPTRLEGFLFPNTYEVAENATAHQVVDIMLKGFDNTVTEEYYEEAKKQGKTIFEVVTMASIVEREASKSEEKPKVASVIENRLKVDMPLQMDSIISYIKKEDKIRATYSDIEVDSAYNPYKNKGLPPGPICAPGIEAIDAALNPAETDYLYFVASPNLDGTNVYSETYADFLKDREKFNKAYEKYIKENPGQQ